MIDLCRVTLDLIERSAAEAKLSWDDGVSDQYWTLSPEDAFQLVDSPEILCGSLADDVQELRESVSSPDSERVAWHESQHAASLVAFLSFRMLGR